MLLILRDVGWKSRGIGVIGAVDAGCDSFVTMDGGYEMNDLESKRSDDISMLAIVVMMNDSG
jgi:hypothetical protein